MYFIQADLINDVSIEKIRKIKTMDEPRTQIFGYRLKDLGVYFILPDSFKKEFCKNRGEKVVKKILIKKNMLTELNEQANGKLKNRNPKVTVNNEREK